MASNWYRLMRTVGLLVDIVNRNNLPCPPQWPEAGPVVTALAAVARLLPVVTPSAQLARIVFGGDGNVRAAITVESGNDDLIGSRPFVLERMFRPRGLGVSGSLRHGFPLLVPALRRDRDRSSQFLCEQRHTQFLQHPTTGRKFRFVTARFLGGVKSREQFS